MTKRSLSYWEVASRVVENTTLTSTPPHLKTDVAIVGAGFCGSWLAYFLLKKNPSLKVTLIERDFLNLGASVRNAGFLSCGNISEWLEDSQAFSWDEVVRTLRARIEGIQIIQKEFGSVPAINCGSADFDPLTDEKTCLLARLNGALTEMGFEPFYEMRNVKIGGRNAVVPFNRFDSEVDPCQLLLQLHDRLGKMGARFQWQTTVNQIGGGEADVTSHGRSSLLRYGHAFICTNGFARKLCPNTVVAPARGQILVTSPCKTDTTRCLGYMRSGYDYFRFIGERVLVGGGRLEFKHAENTDSLEVTQEIRSYLIALAKNVIGHDQFSVDYHWSGIMGLRKGGHAAVSDLEKPVLLDAQTEELAGFGGWGVTLTPYIAARRASSY